MQGGGYDTIVIATNALLTSMKIKLNKAKICVSKNKFNNTWEQNFTIIAYRPIVWFKKKRKKKKISICSRFWHILRPI